MQYWRDMSHAHRFQLCGNSWQACLLDSAHTACARQDAPRDVSAALLAALPSTQAVLAALQRGWAARQRIMAKLPPVKVATLPLCSLQNRATLKLGWVWASQTFESVMFSPDGAYLAAVVKHRQVDPKHEQSDSDSDVSEDFCTSTALESFEAHEMCTYEVIVYKASDGFRLCETFDTQVREPVIQWSPSSCLCVAQLLTQGNRVGFALDICFSTEMSKYTAAFVYCPKYRWYHDWYDSAPHLSSQATAHLSSLGKRCQVHPSWSPSGQYLLVHGAQYPRHDRDKASGWMAIADMEQGRIIAGANFKTAYKSFHEERLCFLWHPSSRALIVQGDVELQDIAAITRAGFGIKQLPKDLCIHPAGFSADASLLIAESYDTWGDRYHMDIYSLECSIQGLQICLGRPQVQPLPYTHEDVYVTGWMPGLNTLLLEVDGVGSPAQVQLSVFGPGAAHSAGMMFKTCNRISSSGKLYFRGPDLDDELYTVIAEVQGGQELLRPCRSDLDWPALHVQPGSLVSKDLPDRLCCHAWAPTGLGPVCSTPGIDRVNKGGGYLPPALHFFRYA